MPVVVKVLVGLFLTLPVVAYVVGTRIGPPASTPAPGPVATPPSVSPHRGVPDQGAVAENPEPVTGVADGESQQFEPRGPAVADRRTPDADPSQDRQAVRVGQSVPQATAPASSGPSPTAGGTATPEETTTAQEPAQTPRESVTDTPDQSASPTSDGTATETPSG